MAIPNYLQGKSAAQIIVEVHKRFLNEVTDYVILDYAKYLEMLLLLAVKDALINADNELYGSSYEVMGREAEDRAVAFLNIILSRKHENDSH